jgi:hypothetical protein
MTPSVFQDLPQHCGDPGSTRMNVIGMNNGIDVRFLTRWAHVNKDIQEAPPFIKRVCNVDRQRSSIFQFHH